MVPFALFMLGISGAWIGNLTALERYQPVFAVIAVACLGYGFYLVYRKQKIACAEGSYCASPSSNRVAKIGLWTASVLVIPVPVNQRRRLMRNTLFAANVAVTALLLSWPVQAAEKTIVLDVKNADCVLCPPIVKQSLLRVPGVKEVKMSQANQMADFMATVTFDDAVANVASLITATTNAGYPTHVANAN
jgi:mercuric transport protein